jgi:hypothetical protein
MTVFCLHTGKRKERALPKHKAYPGGLTREQWRALPRDRRCDLVRRARCDFLGSFRFCSNKACRRARSCASQDPNACVQRLWRLVKKKPKIWRDAYARIGEMTDA